MKLTELDEFNRGLVTGHGNWIACSPREMFYRMEIFEDKIFNNSYVLVIANMWAILQNVHQEEWL